MSRPIPINNLDFARLGSELRGLLDTGDLQRVSDLLSGAQVNYGLSGRVGKQGELLLSLSLKGVLELRCQRCLGALKWHIDIVSEFELRPPDAEISEDDMNDDTRDVLVYEREMSVADLIEDEIILALPVAPTHESCELPALARSGGDAGPFKALATLKKH